MLYLGMQNKQVIIDLYDYYIPLSEAMHLDDGLFNRDYHVEILTDLLNFS